MGNPGCSILCSRLCKPLVGLNVSPDDAGAERYGKTVSDLQSDVAIADGAITGTLAYVTGYTGFSGDASLQEGNYLSLKIADPDATSIKVSIGDRGPVEVKPDGFIVIRLEETNLAEKIVIEDSDGVLTETVEYDISGLTLGEGGD